MQSWKTGHRDRADWDGGASSIGAESAWLAAPVNL